MSSVEWTLNVSGNGVDATISGAQIDAVIIHATNLGESRPLAGGSTPRREYLGWIAFADNVSWATGNPSPDYAWRDVVWVNFPATIFRFPSVGGGQYNMYPDAVQWGMLHGAACTVIGVME